MPASQLLLSLVRPTLVRYVSLFRPARYCFSRCHPYLLQSNTEWKRWGPPRHPVEATEKLMSWALPKRRRYFGCLSAACFRRILLKEMLQAPEGNGTAPNNNTQDKYNLRKHCAVGLNVHSTLSWASQGLRHQCKVAREGIHQIPKLSPFFVLWDGVARFEKTMGKRFNMTKSKCNILVANQNSLLDSFDKGD